MTVIHKHDGEEFHTHSDEEYARHGAMSDEIADSEATAVYAGHTAAGTPAMIERTDVPRTLAEEEAAAQGTAGAEALRESQAQGYQGEDAADAAGGVDALRETMGDAKDGPGAPDFPPGHPNDPTVPTSAGTTTHDGDGGTDAEAGTT